METARDRILKAISHEPSEITPVHIMGIDNLDRWLRHFGASDYLDLRDKLGLDLQEVRPVYRGPRVRAGLDIWGTPLSVGGSQGTGFSGHRGGYPLAEAETAEDVEKFEWPDPDDFDYEVVAEVFRSISADKAKCIKVQYVFEQESVSHQQSARGGGPWIPLICSLFNLFGLEEALVNLTLKPEVMLAAIARIEEFTLEFAQRLLEHTKGMVDIFWYGDDFASQRGLLISPEHWRRFLKPTYKNVFALAKSYGLKVWFHSCGTFRPVLPDLIDIGMDVWETVQVHLKGNEPEVLKREYGRDLAFYGAVNSQRTLPFGTPEQVRAEVRDRIRVLGQGGGYICGSDHTILPDVPIANVLAMLDEAKQFRF